MPAPALAAITIHSASGVSRFGVPSAGSFMLIDSVTESATRSQSRIASVRGVTAQITETDFRYSLEVRARAKNRRGLINRHPGELIPLSMLDWFFDGEDDLHFGWNPKLHTAGYEEQRNLAGRAIYHSPQWTHVPGRLPAVSFVVDVEFSPGAWSSETGNYLPDIDAPGSWFPGTGEHGGTGGEVDPGEPPASGVEPGGGDSGVPTPDELGPGDGEDEEEFGPGEDGNEEEPPPEEPPPEEP